MKKGLSISEAARACGISRQRVHTLIKAGKLPWHGASRKRKRGNGIWLGELRKVLDSFGAGPLALAVSRGIKVAGDDPRGVCYQVLKASLGNADPDYLGTAVRIFSRTRTVKDSTPARRLLRAMSGASSNDTESAVVEVGQHIKRHADKSDSDSDDLLARFDGIGVEGLLAAAFARFLAIEFQPKKRLRAAMKNGVLYDPRIERNHAATILITSPNNDVAYQRMRAEMGMTEIEARNMMVKLFNPIKRRSLRTVAYQDKDLPVVSPGKPLRSLSAAAAAWGITRRTAYAWRRLAASQLKKSASRNKEPRHEIERCLNPDCDEILKPDVKICPKCGRMV